MMDVRRMRGDAMVTRGGPVPGGREPVVASSCEAVDLCVSDRWWVSSNGPFVRREKRGQDSFLCPCQFCGGPLAGLRRVARDASPWNRCPVMTGSPGRCGVELGRAATMHHARPDVVPAWLSDFRLSHQRQIVAVSEGRRTLPLLWRRPEQKLKWLRTAQSGQWLSTSSHPLTATIPPPRPAKESLYAIY